MKSHRHPFWIPALLAVAAGPLFPGNSQEESPGNFISILTYLQPYRSIEISAVESGVIQEILVEEGQKVTEKQPLLKLDLNVVEARLAIAESQAGNEGAIMAAESEFKLHSDRYEKLTSLKGKGVSNQFEIQRQYATMKAAEGALIGAKEQKVVYGLQVEQIKAEIERRILRSPIDGIVVEIVKDIAEAVSAVEAGRDEFLVRVVKVDQLKATAHIPGKFADSLSVGDRMKLAIGESESDISKTVDGVIEFISPVIDSTSQTVRIRLKIENSDHAIQGGSAARLLIPVLAPEP